MGSSIDEKRIVDGGVEVVDGSKSGCVLAESENVVLSHVVLVEKVEGHADVSFSCVVSPRVVCCVRLTGVLRSLGVEVP